MIWVLSTIFGLLIGSVVGLLGGGGALISIPILLYGFHFSFPVAVGTSLLLVTLGALPSLFLYWRKQQINWESALWMGGSGSLGAWIGSKLSTHVAPDRLIQLLIILIVVSALQLFRPSVSVPSVPDNKPSPRAIVYLILTGIGIGILTGLVGVGGGFLIVPALIMIRQLEPRKAIATSLVVIALNALSGMLSYWSRLPLDQPTLYLLMLATLVGSVIGFQLSLKLSQLRLKQVFAVLLIVIAAILVFNPPIH
jgi:uncharacterized membrane protein YfcA